MNYQTQLGLGSILISALIIGCNQNSSEPKRLNDKTVASSEQKTEETKNQSEVKKDEKKTSPEDNKVNAGTQEKFDPQLLLGAWTNCESNIAFFTANSFVQTYTFSESGTFEYRNQYFSDLNCATPLTAAESQTLLDEEIAYFESIGMPLSEADIAESQTLYSTGFQSTGTFQTGIIKDGVAEIDYVETIDGVERTIYSVISIENDSLRLGEYCSAQAAADGFCPVESGTSPENRPTSVAMTTPQFKK